MKSFAEILSEKLNQHSNQSHKNSIDSLESPTQQENFSASEEKFQRFTQELRFASEAFYFQPSRKTQIYQKNSAASSALKAEPAASKTKSHPLNERQQTAYDYYQNLGISLSPSFSRSELKAAFRKLAKKLHPDHGGSPLDFRRLLEHQKHLLSVFSS